MNQYFQLSSILSAGSLWEAQRVLRQPRPLLVVAEAPGAWLLIFPGNPENRLLGFPLSLCSRSPRRDFREVISLARRTFIPCQYLAPTLPLVLAGGRPDVYRILEISLRTRDGREIIPGRDCRRSGPPRFPRVTSRNDVEIPSRVGHFIEHSSNSPICLRADITYGSRLKIFVLRSRRSTKFFSITYLRVSQVGNKVSDEVEDQRANGVDSKRHFELLSFQEHRWI